MARVVVQVCCSKENVARKVRRYEKLDVASELSCPVESYSTRDSGVLEFIPATIDTPSARYYLSSGGCS